MIAGFLIIGLRVVLVYWKVCKLTASQMAKMLSATKIKECFSGGASDQVKEELLKKNLTSSGDVQRKTDALLHQCEELCCLDMTLTKRLSALNCAVTHQCLFRRLKYCIIILFKVIFLLTKIILKCPDIFVN